MKSSVSVLCAVYSTSVIFLCKVCRICCLYLVKSCVLSSIGALICGRWHCTAFIRGLFLPSSRYVPLCGTVVWCCSPSRQTYYMHLEKSVIQVLEMFQFPECECTKPHIVALVFVLQLFALGKSTFFPVTDQCLTPSHVTFVMEDSCEEFE